MTLVEGQTFGGAIAAKRKDLSLSQKELAARILKEDGTSITPQYLNDIEHDRRSPTSDHLVTEFARVLQLAPEYLFILAGKVPLEDVRRASTADATRVSRAILAFRRELDGKKN